MTYSATGKIDAALKAGAIAFATAEAFATVKSIKVPEGSEAFATGTAKAMAMGTVGAVSAGFQGGDTEKGFMMAFGAAAVSAALEVRQAAGLHTRRASLCVRKVLISNRKI
jgi:hypothetical protein